MLLQDLERFPVMRWKREKRDVQAFQLQGAEHDQF